jgi:hypothetical protein
VSLGVVLTGGTGFAVYWGLQLKKTKDRAREMSQKLKQERADKMARDLLRRDWDNEHELLSENAFVGYKHDPQTIGGYTVACPKCKEL